MKFMSNSIVYPRYNMLSNERAALSSLLSNKSKCPLLKNGKVNYNLSLNKKCLGIYREGLSEGSVVGYSLHVENSKGIVIKTWSDGDELSNRAQTNIFISSRYFSCNNTVCRVSLKVYTEG